jgi:pantothenate kinase
VLATFERPEIALRRRGAPFTFDAAALIENVRTLKTTPVTPAGSPDLGLRLPSFDHAIQDPVNDDIHVPSSAEVIIVEGNYLLLDEYPWNTVTQLFNERYVPLALVITLADASQVVRRRSSGDRKRTAH